LEIINKVQAAILFQFGNILDSNEFYLTGGAALSFFYLRHRKSNDLDFFTNNPELILPFSYNLEENLKRINCLTQRQRGLHSFVEILATKDKESTVIHLAQDTPYRIESLKQFPEYPKLKVDSFIDISTNKLLALFSRATLRDFIDIYFLIKRGHFVAEDLVANAKEKDPGFDLYWLGVALERINTFKEDSPEMLLLLEEVDFGYILTFFNQWREKIARELIK
jgi:predicted nucleotidyltransferase component of viral defense system